MNRLAASPLRNLALAVVFVLTVVAAATIAYMAAGWSFADAIYMVLLTVYTVGYGEVHPIDTPYLHAVTIAVMVLGCTGMILVTSVLVQALTASQIQQLLGSNRVKSDIDKLQGHVIVCGFGRIGVMLAKDLAAGGAAFVVLERGDKRFAEARDLGYLAVQGDATDEAALIAAGVTRARILATVLPDDAANVFITLSARGLNPGLQVIARGEAPSTQSKLIQAGADKVVLPTHIGAERIAEMILFPETARFIRGSERMRDFEKVLRDLGLEMEVVVVREGAAAVGVTLEDLETRGKGAFFVVQINLRDGETITRPPRETRINAGDGLVVVGRNGANLNAIFTAPAARPRAGRTTY
jgi:voltage-gated potassium channel Kch